MSSKPCPFHPAHPNPHFFATLLRNHPCYCHPSSILISIYVVIEPTKPPKLFILEMFNPDGFIEVPENQIAIFGHFNTVQCNQTSHLDLLFIDAQKCDYDTVKRAYQKLAGAIHPDKCLNSPGLSRKGLQILVCSLRLFDVKRQYRMKQKNVFSRQ